MAGLANVPRGVVPARTVSCDDPFQSFSSAWISQRAVTVEASLTGRHPVNGVSGRTNGIPFRNPALTDGLFVRVENPVLELPQSGPAIIALGHSPNWTELIER